MIVSIVTILGIIVSVFAAVLAFTKSLTQLSPMHFALSCMLWILAVIFAGLGTLSSFRIYESHHIDFSSIYFVTFDASVIGMIFVFTGGYKWWNALVRFNLNDWWKNRRLATAQ